MNGGFIGDCRKNCEKRPLASSGLYVRHRSVSMEQIASHWTDFHEILYIFVFRKFVRKFFWLTL